MTAFNSFNRLTNHNRFKHNKFHSLRARAWHVLLSYQLLAPSYSRMKAWTTGSLWRLRSCSRLWLVLLKRLHLCVVWSVSSTEGSWNQSVWQDDFCWPRWKRLSQRHCLSLKANNHLWTVFTTNLKGSTNSLVLILFGLYQKSLCH